MNIPKHYSLHSEGDDHFVVHDKRDDKTFKVAKKGMHPANQLKVLKMKKFAHGGEEEDDGQDGVEEGVAPQTLAMSENGPPMEPGELNLDMPKSFIPGKQEPEVVQPEGQISAAPEASAPQPSVSGAPVGSPSSAELQKNTSQAQAAIQKAAEGQQKQNDLMAAQYQKNIDEEQKVMQSQQEKMVQYQTNYDQLSQDVASAKIDPNKYWNEKTTGGKISAVIGMILGGVGAGLSGGPNVALQVMNKNIENDIEAQKANLGNKNSLLSRNLQAQGNMMAATNATRIQMAAIAQGKLQKIAMESNNPIIAARAQQASAQIAQQTMPLRAQLAQHETEFQLRGEVMRKLQHQGQGGAAQVDLHDLARAGIIDKATAEKESASISKRQQAEAYAIDQIQKLDEEQRVFGKNFPYVNPANPESYKRRDQFSAGIIQAIQAASPSKRLNPETLKLQIEPFLTKTMDSDKTREEGMNGILNLIRSHADPTPTASHYGLSGAVGGKNSLRKTFSLGPVK